MKKTLFILCLGMTIINAKATVWTVNNVSYENADFDQIQVAANSVTVMPGDTLYVEGTDVDYENFTLSKKLTIIGSGYFLNQNHKSANVLQATFAYGNTYLENGCDGSVFIGLNFGKTNNYIYVDADNIMIKRCNISGYLRLKDNVQGTFIINNYIGYIDNYTSSMTFSSVTVLNNIIARDLEVSSGSSFASFDNNILLGDEYSFSTGYFRNNIIVDGSRSFEITSSNILNNIGTGGLFSDTKNYNVVDITTLFVGGDIPDAQYILAENSYAKEKGHDGKECGIFGGANPYVLSGLPTIPVITVLDTDGIGTKEDGLRVKIGVKSF